MYYTVIFEHGSSVCQANFTLEAFLALLKQSLPANTLTTNYPKTHASRKAQDGPTRLHYDRRDGAKTQSNDMFTLDYRLLRQIISAQKALRKDRRFYEEGS